MHYTYTYSTLRTPKLDLSKKPRSNLIQRFYAPTLDFAKSKFKVHYHPRHRPQGRTTTKRSREEKTGTSTHRIGDESTPDMSGGLKHRGGSEH
jgi:hypothetical protein